MEILSTAALIYLISGSDNQKNSTPSGTTLTNLLRNVAYVAFDYLTLTLGPEICERRLENRKITILNNGKAEIRAAGQDERLTKIWQANKKWLDLLTELEEPDLSLEEKNRLTQEKKQALDLLEELDSERKTRLPHVERNQVMRGLWLGGEEILKELYERNTNFEKFRSLITLNDELTRAEYDQATKYLDGVYLAETVAEQLDFWPSLVFNATYPNDKELRLDPDKPFDRLDRRSELNDKKKEEIEKVPVEEWFKEIFEELDKAVFEDKKTLVHCRAGAFRSPALVAAYLINRFDVSAKEAINFLALNRSIVSIGGYFFPALEEYEKNLRKAKNKFSI